MGEFYAWAATGVVTGLQTWSEPDRAETHTAPPDQRQRGRTQPSTSRQRFLLRQPDGRDIEILLVNSGIVFRNGHAVTIVWAAREHAPYGHCIYMENHTTGGMARLKENLALIRRKIGLWKMTLLGFFATLPATFGLIGWLLLQRDHSRAIELSFFISAAIAATLLLIIGIVASKLVFDYLNAEDERKIWLAADRALFHARRILIEGPVSPRYT